METVAIDYCGDLEKRRDRRFSELFKLVQDCSRLFNVVQDGLMLFGSSESTLPKASNHCSIALEH
jgi:hypothetical protein